MDSLQVVASRRPTESHRDKHGANGCEDDKPLAHEERSCAKARVASINPATFHAQSYPAKFA